MLDALENRNDVVDEALDARFHADLGVNAVIPLPVVRRTRHDAVHASGWERGQNLARVIAVDTPPRIYVRGTLGVGIGLALIAHGAFLAGRRGKVPLSDQCRWPVGQNYSTTWKILPTPVPQADDAAQEGALVGLAEVADMLGVTKRTATSYSSRDDFPKPLQRLAATPVWRRDEVAAWAMSTLPLTRGRPRRRSS